jgi:two-component system, NtrC family, nitrogen regulation sensor histidine kinase NtrY
MRKRLLLTAGTIVLAVLIALLVWQSSFTFGDYGPSSSQEAYLFWAVSTLVFLLTVTLGFMLFRTGVKLYIERQKSKEGSRIKTRLVVGALTLSFLPVFFLMLWGFFVLNRNLDKWFSRPAENVRLSLIEVGMAMDNEVRERAEAQARWIAALINLNGAAGVDAAFCRDNGLLAVAVERPPLAPEVLCGDMARAGLEARSAFSGGGQVVVRVSAPLDLTAKEREIRGYIDDYEQLARNRKQYRDFYLMMLLLITMFILFVATWVALFFARQISGPIASLLEAAGEVRKGNLGFRIRTRAIDELATLIRAFNEMTQELEGNARELDRRRRFTEAILESIPTGVISITGDGGVKRVNPALKRMFGDDKVATASRLEDIFSREDTTEIKYMMKRARRTGAAFRQIDLNTPRQTLHLAVTVSALEEKLSSGFVVVLEDTSELMRAQRSAAWHEVARRIAHEIKNPLTPISLCAERISRQIERSGDGAPERHRILGECAATIATEVESLRTLVDEFSQFARFPTAQPAPADLNEIVDGALNVFAGRLEDIELHRNLAPNLPLLHLDKEQFKRVVVNLVDNAAEAMQDSLVKQLWVTTQAASPDTVELVVADTGCGVGVEEKEKLFLPYFSTKGRGTGLGLAIVSRILAEHQAQIRVEDNAPTGARFIVEIRVPWPDELEPKPAEAAA